MHAIAMRRSLWLLALPAITFASGFLIAAAAHPLSAIQSSILDRWLPLAALLSAIGALVASTSDRASVRRQAARAVATLTLIALATNAVAFVAPGEGQF